MPRQKELLACTSYPFGSGNPFDSPQQRFDIPMLHRLPSKQLPLIGLAAVIIAGICVVNDYSFQAGRVGRVQAKLNEVKGYSDAFAVHQLDDDLHVAKLGQNTLDCDDRKHGDLILFFHPRCPCTYATIRNLSKARNRLEKPGEFTAFCFLPSSDSIAWKSTEAVELIRSLGANVVFDLDGEWAHRFGVSTSGHVLFYDRHGQLVFNGGVTRSRGHEGTCQSLADLIEGMNGRSECKIWPVFGCSLNSRQG